MEHYDRRMVYAPEWMRKFACLAGDCPDVCCQQWNVDVDPAHAESLHHIEDPELQKLMDSILRSVRIRRPGSRQAETIHRLQLLNQPDKRCPLLNERNECRLHKKYGPYILCDTCYFHPRTYWQVDEQSYLSACLSCPECARLAILHREPTAFSSFEAEIDPNTEWLETSLIPDAGAQLLMENRSHLITALCEILQDRDLLFTRRLSRALDFLEILTCEEQPDADRIRAAVNASHDGASAVIPEDPVEIMRCWLEVFDPVPEALEKPVQGTAELTRRLAGGREGYTRLLAYHYSEGMEIAESFLAENEYLLENYEYYQTVFLLYDHLHK